MKWRDYLVWQTHVGCPAYFGWSYVAPEVTRYLQRDLDGWNRKITPETQQRWLKLITYRQQESWSYFL